MIIGVPKEIKTNENRVAMTPAGVMEMTHEYRDAGATILDTAAEVYGKAEMIVKVKEPIEQEYELIREGQLLFTYFEVAGRMAIQEGAKYLEKPAKGRGVLLGGVPGVPPGRVLVLGGGVVGTQAAKMAAGLGAEVFILDISLPRLRYLADIMPKNVVTLFSNEYNIRQLITSVDLIIGAVLIPGAKAPKLITRDMLKDIHAGAVHAGSCALHLHHSPDQRHPALRPQTGRPRMAGSLPTRRIPQKRPQHH